MKEAKFTKGPWTPCHPDLFQVRDRESLPVATVLSRDDKEDMYNTLLIAQSPAMYELLVKFCDACNKYNIEALVPEYEAACTILNRINP